MSHLRGLNKRFYGSSISPQSNFKFNERLYREQHDELGGSIQVKNLFENKDIKSIQKFSVGMLISTPPQVVDKASDKQQII